MIERLVSIVCGAHIQPPPDLLARFPELGRARWRRGGLALRIGGWCLGRSTVSGITLWRTIALAEGVEPTAELLLHELRHVDQFEADRWFPLRYLWGTLRHGYHDNPYEADARAFAARRVGASPTG